MMRYWIEFSEENGSWDLCTGPDSEGIVDVHASYTTRHDARVAMLEANNDRWNDEQRYWAQYAYACGYWD